MTRDEKQIFWLGVFIGAAFTTLLWTIAWQEPFAAGLLLIAGTVSAFCGLGGRVRKRGGSSAYQLHHEQLGKPFPDFFGATVQA